MRTAAPAARRADGRLLSLTVEGFGLIDRTDVQLGPGLNAFTGETGSGKSMVLDALGFAFGDRAGPDVVRAGAARAIVFVELETSAEARAWTDEHGFGGDDPEVAVLSREMQTAGRSSGRINGKPATAGQLRELGDLLLDVVGQNEHAQLAQASRHLAMLDAFAGEEADALRSAVGAAFAQLREMEKQRDDLRASESASARRLDDARFAADEIAAARLVDNELEGLRERRARLGNATKIAEALAAASDALGEGGGATAQLGRAAIALDPIARYGASFAEMASTAKELQSAASDLAVAIASASDDDANDAAQLDVVEDRLALIERLQKKYGPTIADILAAGERYAAEASSLSDRGATLAQLETAIAAMRRTLNDRAARLSEKRREAATLLGERVAGELAGLGMKGATFRCAVTGRDDGIGPSGGDRVEFVASLNPNEPERPIAKAASGGELSRLLLALKIALAGVDRRPVVVLDEVDAGIGGAAARAVGARIAALAQTAQVLCVTHLAQIAAFAQAHVVLEKRQTKGRVAIFARVLGSAPDVRTEIARMLSGDAEGSEALRHADALLRDVRTK